MSSRDDVIVLSNFEELFNNELQKETIVDTRQIEVASWKEVIPRLAPVLTSNQISVLLVSYEFYQEVVGRLKSELTDIFQRKYGESVVINGRSVLLNRFFNFSFVLNKVVSSSKKTVDENELKKFTNLKEILKDVNELHDCFPNIGNVLFHAAKSVQKRTRKYIEIQKKYSELKNSDSENDEKCLEIVQKDDSNDGRNVAQSQRSLRTVLKRRKLKSVIKKLAKVTSEVNYDELNQDNEEENGVSNQQKCYICKTRYSPSTNSDEYANRYTHLCYDCSKHNNEMRNMRSNLSGKYAIVTGARLKIGYATTLKLLRDGCYVIATTRFPNDAAQRYSNESDYDVWCDRLKIYPIDLLDVASVYRFVEYVNRTLPYLDILINNAAQTISRPLDFYKHLFLLERSDPKLLDVKQRKLLVDGIHLSYPETPIGELKLPRKRRYEEETVQDGGYFVTFPSEECCSSSNSDFSKDQALVSTAKETTLNTKQEEATESVNEGILSPPKKPRNETFPDDHFDQDGQQVDLREFNSWRYTLSDVPFKELTDVLTINTLAPFILTSQLRTLMCKSPSENKFIVNVSAMEGQFHRKSKTCDHPHTNMAKAALNMLTRTSGLELVNDGIYMTAVDTGWVTDERPFQNAEYERVVNKFKVPLDCIDGSARVYHPILHGLQLETQPYFAVFLKDYKPCPW